jgi:glycosyltransferase involved in cell wall biosynthesis
MRIWLSDGDRRLQEDNGYGRVSAALAKGLTALGHEVQFKQFRDMDLGLFVCPPGRIKFGRAAPYAALAMHELDHLPEGKRDWGEIVNRLDLLITPTDWNLQMWRREGVTIPIEVVPLGIDVTAYHPPCGRTCTFLTVHENLGGLSSRENWWHTLRAYCSAFTAADDVRLQIKTWKWKPEEWQARLQRTLFDFGLDEDTAPAIEIVEELLSVEQMRALYQGAWLFIKNANREGWSLPCTEALACGIPVAATRIEPLLSLLPQDTRWFEHSDVEGLARILRREHSRFHAELRRAQRYSDDVMVRLVEGSLMRMLRGRADEQHGEPASLTV